MEKQFIDIYQLVLSESLQHPEPDSIREVKTTNPNKVLHWFDRLHQKYTRNKFKQLYLKNSKTSEEAFFLFRNEKLSITYSTSDVTKKYIYLLLEKKMTVNGNAIRSDALMSFKSQLKSLFSPEHPEDLSIFVERGIRK